MAAAARPIVQRVQTNIYRPFFLAGGFTVLTTGCLLGAFALLGVSMNKSYTASAWTPYVLAHANSQLFGWVCFFVMGFTLQQHAPTVAKQKLFHQLAWWSLGLMSLGIIVRFIAEPMIHISFQPWQTVGVVSCCLQTVSVAIFYWNVTMTRDKTNQKVVWQTRYVFASIFWLAAIALAEPFIFAYSHQADPQTSVLFVANWFPVVREVQFLGFVAQMIFGVSLVKLHSCFGGLKPNEALGKAAFALWNIGLVVRCVGWLSSFNNGLAESSLSVFYLGGTILAFGGFLVVLSVRIFEPWTEQYRSHKFVRAAYAWLLIAGMLLVLEPITLRTLGIPFSHAYTGAIRHAITVGFISQMILGFSLHVGARMNDLEERYLPALMSAFLLLNLGNALRVFLEVATEFTQRAFSVMGATGFIELIALVIWASQMMSMLSGRIARRQHA